LRGIDASQDEVPVDAAFLAIEVLSEDDRMTKTMERLEEFDRNGVPNIWVIDPRLRTVAVYSKGVLNEVRGASVATQGDPCLELTHDEIFQDVE
jgi:Uma2 family endonuclease